MERTDIHRPSAINPSDYQYVGMDYIRVDNLGDALALRAERDRIQAHRTQTGGRFSTHEHGGSCYICGSVNAVYLAVFYHPSTNAYIKVGTDCAEKLDMGHSFEMNRFRSAVEDAREAQAGKRKAQALLADAGLSAAWSVYETAGYPAEHYTDPAHVCNCKHPEYEEITIRDIVSKLIRYGSISDKAMDFVRSLLTRIEKRDEINAQRAAEKAAAADCPTGRVTITGTVLKVADYENQFGYTTKMTVKSAEGFIVFCTVPSSMTAERGQVVSFVATVTPSDNDPKFGFGKRPVAAK